MDLSGAGDLPGRGAGRRRHPGGGTAAPVQSNVTTRVRQLEDELGVPLFIREGKRLHLAPAGQVLLGYADRLLALADEAREAVRDAKPRGLFRLGAMESTAARCGCPGRSASTTAGIRR